MAKDAGKSKKTAPSEPETPLDLAEHISSPPPNDGDEESSSEQESSEDDDLVLEGVVVRNFDISDEEEDDDDNVDDEDEDSNKVAATPAPSRPHSFTAGSTKRKAAPEKAVPQKKSKGPKKKGKEDDVDDTLQVDFTFCDMEEKYFNGLKSLLHSSSTVYQVHSSELSDLMIENVAVGTVVGTSLEDEAEADVFGFASVLNVSTTDHQQSPAIQFLKNFSLKHCPARHRKDLEAALQFPSSSSSSSSSSGGPAAGFLLHARMINMPLEIVHELHRQLVLDMDWAVDNAEDEAERRSLDFGAFIRLAPCQQQQQQGTASAAVYYKYFDDEIFADNAEFVYAVDAPKSYSKEDKQLVSIMLLTKRGHRAAMADLSKLVHGR